MARVIIYSHTRVTVAIIAGKSAAMDAAAHTGLQIARGLAARHVDTGAYIRSLKVVTVPGRMGSGRRVDDRLIVATDPGAAAIEFGSLHHFPNSRRVRWTPGQHILTRTKDMM